MVFIYVPCQNIDTAKAIAKLLVERRMAGKVDIMPTNSVSRVDGLSAQSGGVVESTGATMIIKTIDKHIQGVEDVVRQHYQNGTPCIASISLYRMNRDFKDWLIASTA